MFHIYLKYWYSSISFHYWEGGAVRDLPFNVKPNSPQEKSVKKHACGLLRIIVRLKMPSKRSVSTNDKTLQIGSFCQNNVKKNIDVRL